MNENKPGIPAKVIDITRLLKPKNPTYRDMGKDILESLTVEEADAMFGFVFDMILTNVEIGLGVIDTDDNPVLEKAIEQMTDEDMFFFKEINDIYRKAHSNCYFCRDDVDPNGEPITKETHICLRCQLKLGNFLEHVGIPREKIFKLQGGGRKINPE